MSYLKLCRSDLLLVPHKNSPRRYFQTIFFFLLPCEQKVFCRYSVSLAHLPAIKLIVCLVFSPNFQYSFDRKVIKSFLAHTWRVTRLASVYPSSHVVAVKWFLLMLCTPVRGSHETMHRDFLRLFWYQDTWEYRVTTSYSDIMFTKNFNQLTLVFIVALYLCATIEI